MKLFHQITDDENAINWDFSYLDLSIEFPES